MGCFLNLHSDSDDESNELAATAVDSEDIQGMSVRDHVAITEAREAIKLKYARKASR